MQSQETTERLMLSLPMARVICLVASLMCVPAFLYGVAFLWISVMAVGAVVLVGAHLRTIITRFKGWTDKKARCIATLKYYAKMSVEIALICTVGPAIFIYMGLNYTPSAIDQIVLNYSPLHWVMTLFDQTYANNAVKLTNQSLNITSYISYAAIFMVVLAVIISRKILFNTSAYIAYGRSVSDFQDTDEIEKSSKYQFYNFMGNAHFLGPALLIFYLIAVLFFLVEHAFSTYVQIAILCSTWLVFIVVLLRVFFSCVFMHKAHR